MGRTTCSGWQPSHQRSSLNVIASGKRASSITTHFQMPCSYLGNVAFRDPVPAYKHSAAVFLDLVGRIPSDRTHPRNPHRPTWESEILADCPRRLGYKVKPPMDSF